jgi:hypothetical protein
MNKQIHFFVIAFLLGLCSLNAQNGLESALKKINKLKGSKVDTLVSVYRYSSGMSMPTKKGKDCFLTSSQMIIWTKDGEYFKQVFDNCNDYKEKKIDSSIFIKYLRDSLAVLKTAEIKPVACVFVDMAGGRNTKKNSKPLSSKITEMMFVAGRTTLVKKIDHYDLFTEGCDAEYLNENYEPNMASILKRLFDEADQEFRDK